MLTTTVHASSKKDQSRQSWWWEFVGGMVSSVRFAFVCTAAVVGGFIDEVDLIAGNVVSARVTILSFAAEREV